MPNTWLGGLALAGALVTLIVMSPLFAAAHIAIHAFDRRKP